MVGKKKMPDDMDLFRRKVGDVRRLKVSNRVAPPSRVSKLEAKLKIALASEKRDASSKDLCLRTPDKNMYESMHDAARAADYVRQELRETVRPYKCDSCDKYHLTSK